MAKKQTKKSTFPSRYAIGKFVTPAQYLAEMMSERYARKQNKDLPLEFWNNEEWAKFFVEQITAANTLLKCFTMTAILNALQRKENKWVYSLRLKKLNKDIVEEEFAIQNRQKDRQSTQNLGMKEFDIAVRTTMVTSKPLKPFTSKKNIKNKLKD